MSLLKSSSFSGSMTESSGMCREREWFYLVGSEDEGKTVGEVLRTAGFSKREISRQKFLPRGILLDGEQCRVTCKVHKGQTVSLLFQERAAGSMEMASGNMETASGNMKMSPGSMRTADIDAGEMYVQDAGIRDVCRQDIRVRDTCLKVQVYYEDEDLLVVYKPSGLACHLGRGHYSDNLGSALQSCLGNDRGDLSTGRGDSSNDSAGSSGDVSVVRLIGRLDRDTSGLVVLAKSRMAAARLWQQHRAGIFVKYYQAFVHGHMQAESGTIEMPIMKVPGEKNVMKTDAQGLRAVTHYRVLAETQLLGQEASFLEFFLETGRTHQIRVHMASEGHPLFGDPIYGVCDKAPRLCLHAQRVRLRQPFTGEKIEVCTPQFTVEDC